MERTQIFDLMGELKLYGMKDAFDEIMATAIKRQHEPQRIVGDLLTAEISEKQARSIKYQLTIAKLPLAKDIDDFQFDGTTRPSSMISPAAASSPSSAMSFWSAAPVPARPIWPSLSPEAVSAMVPAAASTTSSISSTGSRPRPATAGRAGLPIT